MKSQVGILGAGMMGAAISKVYLDAGYPVSIWNRSQGRCEELQHSGASVASSVAALVSSNEIIFCNVTTYEILRELIDPTRGSFTGRLFVNLVTGTAEDARSAAAFIQAAGGLYLDGAIEGYPSDIGNQATLIAYAGQKALWGKHNTFLQLAGGASRWVGEDPAAANVFDTAMAGAFGIGCLGAFVEAAHYASSAGVGLNELEGSIEYFLTLARREMASVIEAMSKKDFAGGDAPLSIYASALHTWQANMKESGVPAVLISAHLRAIELAVSEGKGAMNLAATYI